MGRRPPDRAIAARGGKAGTPTPSETSGTVVFRQRFSRVLRTRNVVRDVGRVAYGSSTVVVQEASTDPSIAAAMARAEAFQVPGSGVR